MVAAGQAPAALAAQNRRLLDTMLRNYFELEVVGGHVGEVLAAERRFRFDLDGSTNSGYIDRIDRLPSGRLRLLDCKTTKSAMSRDQEADRTSRGLSPTV
jgi:RecB family exonuclease